MGGDIADIGQRSLAVMMATPTLLITAPSGMGHMHEGKQYVVEQIMGQTYPGSLVALRLP
jgi:hypothetical protein